MGILDWEFSLRNFRIYHILALIFAILAIMMDKFFKKMSKGLAKKTFLWLFIILPIIVVLYTFAPTFLAVGLAVFMLIGGFASVDKSAKSFRLKKL